MSVWQWTLACLLLIVLFFAVAIAFPVWRRRRISAATGTFDLALNFSADHTARGWILGIARYGEDELEWFAIFGFGLTPRYRFRRSAINVDSRSRIPAGWEASSLQAGNVVVECRTRNGIQQLALTPSALTGLLAWLESSPPGHRVNNVL